jgi:hypothetical protein
MNPRILAIAAVVVGAAFALIKYSETSGMVDARALTADVSDAEPSAPAEPPPPPADRAPKRELAKIGEEIDMGTMADAGPGKKWKSPMEQHGFTHEDFKIPIPFVPPTELPFDRAAVGEVKAERLEGSYDIREKLTRSVQRALVYSDTLERELVAANRDCARAAAALMRAAPLWADVDESYQRDEWKPDGAPDDVGFYLRFEKKHRLHMMAMFDRLEDVLKPIDAKCKGTEPFESAMKKIF